MNGLRNPTLYEMFGTDNFGYSGNKDLKPEKSSTYEVYSRIILNEYLNLSLRAFRSNIYNNIEYINNKYQNDSDNVDLNQSGFNNQLNINFEDIVINLFASFLSSKKENGEDQLRRPEKNYGLNFSKIVRNNFFGKLKFNVIYNHYGKHFDTHSHQRYVQPGPLVLGSTPLNSSTRIADRDRTVSRRSEPSSRTTLIGEQPNPWDLLQPQDVMSRHRGAKHCRRYELLGSISLLSPAYLLSVERWPFHSEPPDHYDRLSSLLDLSVSQSGRLMPLHSTNDF